MAFRPATSADTPLVNATFLNAMRASSFGLGCDNEPFFRSLRRAWESARAELQTTVAHPAEQPAHIVGYAVHGALPVGPGQEPMLTLAWIFVTREWRSMGAGRRLLEAAGVRQHERFLAPWAYASRDLIRARTAGYAPVFAPLAMLRWL